MDRPARPAGDEPRTSRVLDAAGVRRLYDRVAPVYDALVKPYDWIGAGRLVASAISELRLAPGDTVVELGVGTGRNLSALSASVSPTGRVVGVDVSPGMLRRAADEMAKRGLGNVELVEADMATFEPPPGTAAVLSTYAIEMLPEYDELIGRLARRLEPGGRISVAGLRDPERWPEWIVRIGSAINRPFGVASDYRSHHPWEAIEAHTTDTTCKEALAGAVYMAAGTTSGDES